MKSTHTITIEPVVRSGSFQKPRQLHRAFAAATVAFSLFLLCESHASIKVYEDLPVGLDPALVSRHGVGGPILADDFSPVNFGLTGVTQVEWWGSAATSDQWELAFHTNSLLNQPNIDNPVQGAAVKYFVTAAPVADGGLFRYTATLPGDFSVAFGNTYWFTAANFDPGWLWAFSTEPPELGSESFIPVRSVGIGLDGGPHSGPWVPIDPPGSTRDLAFRIGVVPEPGTALGTCVALLLGVMLKGRRPEETRRSKQAI